MSARTKLRDDFDTSAVLAMAKASKEAAQTRRLMTIAWRAPEAKNPPSKLLAG